MEVDAILHFCPHAKTVTFKYYSWNYVRFIIKSINMKMQIVGIEAHEVLIWIMKFLISCRVYLQADTDAELNHCTSPQKRVSKIVWVVDEPLAKAVVVLFGHKLLPSLFIEDCCFRKCFLRKFCIYFFMGSYGWCRFMKTYADRGLSAKVVSNWVGRHYGLWWVKGAGTKEEIQL